MPRSLYITQIDGELAILLLRSPERSYTTLALQQRTKSRFTSLATLLAKQRQLHSGTSNSCDPDMSTKDDETNVTRSGLVWTFVKLKCFTMQS